MQTAVAIVHAFGGVARRDQILAAGCSGTDITAAVRGGELRRIRRAHYASARASADAVAAIRVGGRLAGLTAAASYGLWAGFDCRCHVVVPHNASRLRRIVRPDRTTPDTGDREVVVHWQDAAPHAECWRVGLSDALRQVVAWSDAETAMATLDTALDRRLVTKESLRLMFAAEPTASRVRAAAAVPGSGSGYESIVARRLRSLGFRVRQQVPVPGVGRIDAEVEDYLFLEIDGSGFHDAPAARDVDATRDAALVALGRPVIRLRTRRIRDDWTGCLADIRGSLAHRPASPRSQETLGRMSPVALRMPPPVDSLPNNS